MKTPTIPRLEIGKHLFSQKEKKLWRIITNLTKCSLVPAASPVWSPLLFTADELRQLLLSVANQPT